MANWTQKSYDTVVKKYPELEAKSEAVALCTWAYGQDSNFDTQELKGIGEKAGVSVAGRAQGSARQILGLKAKTKRKKAGKKRRRGRRGITSSKGNLGSLSEIVDTMKNMERDHARMRSALERIKGLIDNTLV